MILFDDKDNININEFDEFIPSYFTWQTLDSIKKRSKELSNMTKDDK